MAALGDAMSGLVSCAAAGSMWNGQIWVDLMDAYIWTDLAGIWLSGRSSLGNMNTETRPNLAAMLAPHVYNSIRER